MTTPSASNISIPDSELGAFLREDAAAIRRGGFIGSGEAFAKRLERAADLIALTDTRTRKVEEETARIKLGAEDLLRKVAALLDKMNTNDLEISLEIEGTRYEVRQALGASDV